MTTPGWTTGSGRRGIRTATLTGVLTLALGAGAASAFWTGYGSGSGTAGLATMQTVTVDALVSGDNPGSKLIPGGTADVILRVTNPNQYAVQAYRVTANGPAIADSNHPGCTVTGVTLTGTGSPLSPAIELAANSTAIIPLPGMAAMDTTSQSACQGSNFQLPVTLEARK